MALHYNLSKVYALSDNDPEFVNEILTLFVTEVPDDLAQIKEGIKKKDHKHAYAYAHKIKPTLDLLGMNMAFEEILQVEAWTKIEGKRKDIDHTFDSIKTQIKEAIKEIKKDFNL
ncbi:MAG: Hpt domain-containing protein [Flavobacteriaceae bacterium]|jgi:HPt (histidine-containing phosphotransfer) domain-containing protein|uniref:Hpt domain-containing protein n=1 Tax=Flavobacterium kayseriense TaxID=2764714 RepID=A0ABR7JA25_9FLAO|nr:Hpt domain-containing protein [Flavobacterium kayseriense]MBC5842316.1 Hpt domain-containing protein [Flavobacterium kayseriense]MBC5848846.1 Hpt domain-containing protein [Flavobacterium kayseriense]MBX9887266.1 Hpt domain-containing protein [Flavobacteriaceae bacterium]